jgi:lysophospholipid acyltransferase (LPLAT)-like uncharacterized protein
VHPFTRKQRLALAIVPPLAATLIRLLGMTLRYRDIAVPGVPIEDDVPRPSIYAFWHRTLLCCACHFRNRGIAILISQSFDGELIARTVEHLGFVPIRGSSSRGGAPGLRAMAQAYADGHYCAFTADGPRGPSMVAKPGPVQLAQLTGATWIGAFYAVPDRAWILRSWDRFLIPKPFSTITITWPAHAAVDPAALQRALDASVTMAGPSHP